MTFFRFFTTGWFNLFMSWVMFLISGIFSMIFFIPRLTVLQMPKTHGAECPTSAKNSILTVSVWDILFRISTQLHRPCEDICTVWSWLSKKLLAFDRSRQMCQSFKKLGHLLFCNCNLSRLPEKSKKLIIADIDIDSLKVLSAKRQHFIFRYLYIEIEWTMPAHSKVTPNCNWRK